MIHRWVDGPEVLTWFDVQTTTAGPMAIVNWSHVEDGCITRTRWLHNSRTVAFDPHAMLG